jgi:histidyl-tRNA synthetase
MPTVMVCLQNLRAMGVSVSMQASSAEGMASMKSQFKRADASGARFALIFGADEMAQGVVTVKALRDSNIAQQSSALGDIAQWGKSLQSNA